MNFKDQEQLGVFKRYLLQQRERFRSRLIKEQLQRWVERIDAIQQRERDHPESTNKELPRAA